MSLQEIILETFNYQTDQAINELKEAWGKATPDEKNSDNGKYGNTPLTRLVGIPAIREVTKSSEIDELIDLIIQDPIVDVNKPDKIGSTALEHAMWNNSLVLFNKLLERPDIDINKQNKRGNTLLHLLSLPSMSLRDQYADILLNRPEIDVNIQNEDKETPLHKAIENYFTPIVSKLLNHPKIDLTIKNENGKTPLEISSPSESTRKLIEEQKTKKEISSGLASRKIPQEQESTIQQFLGFEKPSAKNTASKEKRIQNIKKIQEKSNTGGRKTRKRRTISSHVRYSRRVKAGLR